MGKLDLSKAADFSLLTQQALLNGAALFGGRDPNEWDIVEASYNGVLIHVFQTKAAYQGGLASVQDSGGRRLAEFKYPYVDGQTTDDLGRQPVTFNFDFMIFGLRYMQAVNQIMRELNSPKPGTLVHPVMGQFTVKPKDVQITHESQSRKCAHFTVSFVEHNFTIGSPRQIKDSSVKGALSTALTVFSIIDRALAKIEAAQLLVRGIKTLLTSYLNVYKGTNAGTLTQMNSTFNTKGGAADIPALLLTNFGGIRNADGTTSTSNFIVARSPNDPFNAVPAELLSSEYAVATAITSITNQVKSRREELAVILKTIYANGGAHELYDTIIELRTTAVLLQDVLEKGIASSNARVIDYKLPRLMSLREVAFENGISPNRVQELDLLNPSLLSINYIEANTVLKVPVS